MKAYLNTKILVFIVGASLSSLNSFAMMEVKDIPAISQQKYERAELELTKSTPGISFQDSQGIFAGECYSKVGEKYSHFSEDIFLTITLNKQSQPAAFAWLLTDYYSPMTLRRAFNPGYADRDIYAEIILKNTRQLLNGEFLNHEIKNLSLQEADGKIFSTAFDSYEEKSFQYKNWKTDFYQHNASQRMISVSKGDLRFTYPAREVSQNRTVVCVWYRKLY